MPTRDPVVEALIASHRPTQLLSSENRREASDSKKRAVAREGQRLLDEIKERRKRKIS